LRTLGWACTVSVAYALLLLATSPKLAMVWDEGDTIVRAERIAGDTPDDPPEPDPPRRRGRPPRPESAWPFTIEREGHPPLAGVVIAAGMAIAPSWLDPLSGCRLGPMLLFAAAAGAMFYRLKRDYQTPVVGLVAVAMLALMPRLFAHEHYATLDGPLAACWIIAWAAFAPAVRDLRWAPAFGLALGLVLSAKFTGWLAPIPFALWAYFFRDRGAWKALAVAVPIAVVVFVAFNPPLWQHPLDGLWRFFELNLSRQRSYNISTQFFGQMYNLEHPLPWYNAVVWLAVTVSPMTLVFGLYGVVATVRRWRDDRPGTLLVCQWATLLAVRALPMAPPHDAERLILPSFAFFAALVGVGFGRALYRDSLLSTEKIIAQGWAKVALAITLTAASWDAVSYFPHNLSYYNRLIAGLRGATALGMEPTYYWDSLDAAALGWLREHTVDGQRIAFAAAPPRNIQLLVRWGLLPPRPAEPGPADWYVLQRRPSAWRPWDRWLIEHEEPAYQHSFLGVPLLDIYSGESYLRAQSVAK
jgi:4-amino-4-deoxy-L-arabinose transferase-like glycosyltransferase